MYVTNTEKKIKHKISIFIVVRILQFRIQTYYLYQIQGKKIRVYKSHLQVNLRILPFKKKHKMQYLDFDLMIKILFILNLTIQAIRIGGNIHCQKANFTHLFFFFFIFWCLQF